jgi:serine/threonine protein kinase
MSPEQQSGDSVDSRTDLYSLGVTLYEALAGKTPTMGHYEEIAAANEAIPPAIDDLVLECLKARDQRVQTAREFNSRLSAAFRPIRPLSEILAHGRLHELASALTDVSAEDFARLPAGQRFLTLTKLTDLVDSGDSSLTYAAESLLALLVERAVLLKSEDYRMVVKPAVTWAFEQNFGSRIGSEHIRDALEKAAYFSRGQAYTVIRDEISDYLSHQNLEEKQDWYLHWVRQLTNTLLANPECSDGFEPLVIALRQANQIQRGRKKLGTS